MLVFIHEAPCTGAAALRRPVASLPPPVRTQRRCAAPSPRRRPLYGRSGAAPPRRPAAAPCMGAVALRRPVAPPPPPVWAQWRCAAPSPRRRPLYGRSGAAPPRRPAAASCMGAVALRPYSPLAFK